MILSDTLVGVAGPFLNGFVGLQRKRVFVLGEEDVSVQAQTADYMEEGDQKATLHLVLRGEGKTLDRKSVV